MGKHVVVGAGGMGRGIATHLARAGEEVVLASRHGVMAPPPGVRGAQVDAADAQALATLAAGATTLVDAVNPTRYTDWPRQWPPIAAAMLAAAQRTGAGLVTVSNLYAYGRVDGPITESTALAPVGAKGRVRAAMWRDALAAHEAGRVRVCELRASDYLGPGATPGQSYANGFVVRPAARGRAVRLVMGDPDAPHSWTYLPDAAAFGAVLATDERAWGRAWHVPSAAPRSVREVVADVAAVLGTAPVRVGMAPAVVRRLLRVSPLIRELDETAHQFERPWAMDDSAARGTFGVSPTPWPQALEETVRWVGRA